MPLSFPPIAFRTDLSVATVEIGGTGANTAAGARANLSVPAIADLAETNANLLTRTNGKASARGLRFNGTAGVPFELPSEIGTGDLTVLAFIRPDNVVGEKIIAGRSSGSGSFSILNNALRWYDTTTNGKTFTSTVSAGKFQHVALVRSAGVVTPRVEGVAGDTLATAHNITGTAWQIGAYNSNLNPFAGDMVGICVFNCALTQAQIDYHRETGNIPTELLPNLVGNPAGVVLNNLAFANAAVGSGFEYETFTGASASGFTAENSAANGFAYMNGGPSYTARVGDSFGISYDLTLNSGQAPSFVIGANQVALTPGIGKFTVLPITAAVTSYFGISNSAATDFALANVKIFALGCEFAIDPNWDGRGNVPNIAGTGNHGILPASGVYPTNARSVVSAKVVESAGGYFSLGSPIMEITMSAGTTYTADQVLASVTNSTNYGPLHGLFHVVSQQGSRLYLSGAFVSDISDTLVASAGRIGGDGCNVKLVSSWADFKPTLTAKVATSFTNSSTVKIYVFPVSAGLPTSIVK